MFETIGRRWDFKLSPNVRSHRNEQINRAIMEIMERPQMSDTVRHRPTGKYFRGGGGAVASQFLPKYLFYSAAQKSDALPWELAVIIARKLTLSGGEGCNPHPLNFALILILKVVRKLISYCFPTCRPCRSYWISSWPSLPSPKWVSPSLVHFSAFLEFDLLAKIQRWRKWHTLTQ